jgi:hypothetical protein
MEGSIDVIYTAIVGGKDKPRDDIKVFKGIGRFKDPRIEARMYKILFHKFIDDEYSIWIDGNVILDHPEEYYYKLLEDKDIAVCEHPYVVDVFQEANICIRNKLDNPKIIKEQIKKYRRFEQKKHAQSTMIIRRNTPEIRKLCESWWAELCRYSVRDQISFPWIFGEKAIYLNIGKEIINHQKNKYFKIHRRHLK